MNREQLIKKYLGDSGLAVNTANLAFDRQGRAASDDIMRKVSAVSAIPKGAKEPAKRLLMYPRIITILLIGQEKGLKKAIEAANDCLADNGMPKEEKHFIKFLIKSAEVSSG